VVRAEFVRARLARAISARYRDGHHRLYVVTLDPALEDRIREGLEHSQRGWSTRLSPLETQWLCRRIASGIEPLVSAGRPPIVLASPPARAAVKQLTAATLPGLVVLGFNEITSDTQIESVALVDDA
jgi:flagellar biosynthesis protein FlhA